MFGRQPVFSPLVAQFDHSLNSLTWNDGNLIQHLTGLAKNAPPTDVDIIAACITFRIIMNPQGAKIPVIYLMDSITKNSGPLYGQAFEKVVPTLIPAIYDIMNVPADKERITKLVGAWMTRSAFPAPLLVAIQSSLKQSDARLAAKPFSTGWPSELPPGSETLPQAEKQISEYFYKYMFPMSEPTADELIFARDSLAALARLLGPLNAQLGRMHDPEIDNLLQNYDQISQLKTALANGGSNASTTKTIEHNIKIETPSLPPSSSHFELPTDPRILNQLLAPAIDRPTTHTPPPQQPHYDSVSHQPPAHVPPTHAHIPPNHAHIPPAHTHVAPVASASVPSTSSAASGAPSISDPRSLSKYHQANINMLYKNLPHRCTTCGMRFKTNEELQTHLNWHYYERTLLGSRQGARSQKLQRQWYLSAQEWVDTCGGTRGQSMEEKANGSATQGSDEGASGDNMAQIVRIEDSEHEQQAICHACGDEIDQPDYDETGWFYPNTVRGVDGNLYHAKCAASIPSLNSSINLNNSLQLNASVDLASPSKKRSHQDSESDVMDSSIELPTAKKPKIEE